MIEYYNAFISYKHAPLDSKVAADVQRSLERFHIPMGIQKKTGKKKIERVFRDKDELPITSDLTDTISNALEKADYLIVICSPETKKSVWVKREIQYFLKNHTKNQVLTVLADGEPEEVIPEELLSDEREVENEAGIKYTIKVPIEPLSCDYRMPLKRAHKEELPRLASAVIGCSYDELVRRQRQYKLRRLTIAFVGFSAAALAFGAYMYYSKTQIDNNYRESLANQSRYLANESAQLFDKSLRIDALQLALAAIPKDENDKRPVTAEAVKALMKATLAYQGLEGLSIGATWNYNSNGRIRDFKLSPDGTKLLVQDDSDNIMLWDTKTHKKLADLKFTDTRVAGFTFTNDKVFIVWNSEKITGYDTETGEKRWTFKESDTLFTSDCYMEYDNNNFLVYSGSMDLTQFFMIKINTGEKVQTYKIEKNDVISSYSDFKLSPDRKTVAFINSESMNEGNYCVYDLDTGKMKMSENITDRTYTEICWVDSNRFAVHEIDYTKNSSSSLGGTTVLVNSLTAVKLIDANSLNMIWESNFLNGNVSYNKGFINLPKSNTIAYFAGDHCTSYDIATGVTVNDWVTGNPLVDVSDRDGDGYPLFITVEGGMGNPIAGSNYEPISYSIRFADNIRKAVINNGVYVMSKNYNQIIFYDTKVCDDEWTRIVEDKTFDDISDYYLDDKVLVIVQGYGQPIDVSIIDPETGKLLSETELTSKTESTGNFKLLGRIGDKVYIALSGIRDNLIYSIDIASGELGEIKMKGDSYMSDDSICINDDKIVYVYSEKMQRSVCILDPVKDKTKTVEVDFKGIINFEPLYSANAGLVYLSTKDDDFIINIKEETVERVQLPSEWGNSYYVAINEVDQEFAVADESNILITDFNGEVKTTIYCGGHKPVGMTFYDEPDVEDSVLLVSFSEGSLMKYNCSTGEFISKSDITSYDSVTYRSKYRIDTENRILYIISNRLVDIVDLDSWLEIAYVPYCFGYHEGTERFFTVSYESSREQMLGYYRRYTLEDLVKKAEKILDGTEMSAEMRAEYGL